MQNSPKMNMKNRYLSSSYQQLVGQHESEDDFVPLKETPLDVQIDFIGHKFDNVDDALAGKRRLLTVVNGLLIERVELHSHTMLNQTCTCGCLKRLVTF